MSGSIVVSHLLFVIAFVAGLLILGSLLRQRRSPQSALAWIAFAVLLPYIAIPLFFLLGWRKLARPTPIEHRTTARTEQPLQELIASYGIAPVQSGNRLRLCKTGEEAHAALVDLIESARERIEIEIFILHGDDEGRDILERLCRRAADGIAVRVVLDGLGSLTTGPWTLRKLRKAGGDVRFFQPLWRPSEWRRANLRNHRKIVIVDGERVLAGGINIANEYLGPEPDPARWTDLAFLVEGPVVADYQSVLDTDWCYASGRSSPDPVTPAEAADATEAAEGRRCGEARLQVLPSGPDVTEDAMQAVLLQAIYSARERIWMVTPYFVPDSEILQALAVAARRGVEVRLIVPAVSNHRLADWARGPYVRDLERQGGQVRLFQDGMLHAKAVLVDTDLAMLGSANLDLRSLYIDFEIVLLVYDEASVAGVATWIRELDVRTTPTEPEVGRLQDAFEGAVRLLAPLL